MNAQNIWTSVAVCIMSLSTKAFSGDIIELPQGVTCESSLTEITGVKIDASTALAMLADVRRLPEYFPGKNLDQIFEASENASVSMGPTERALSGLERAAYVFEELGIKFLLIDKSSQVYSLVPDAKSGSKTLRVLGLLDALGRPISHILIRVEDLDF